MTKLTFPVLIVMFVSSVFAHGQKEQNRYEVELFANPNVGRKDTREVNAVIIFDKEKLIIQSRRRKETLREFNYSDLRSVEHSYSKGGPFSIPTWAAILGTAFTGIPIFLLRPRKEKHWLNVVGLENFAVLKIENDNFRMIRNEFAVRKVNISEINEDRK